MFGCASITNLSYPGHYSEPVTLFPALKIGILDECEVSTNYWELNPA